MMLPRTERYRICAERGMTIAEVARLYGVTTSAVRQLNRKHDLGFGVKSFPRDRDLPAMRERLTALAQQGQTQVMVSLALGVPLVTIKRWSRAWGVQWAGRRGGKKCYADRLRPHLTPAQMDDLTLLRRKFFSYQEALVSIKRPDLLELLP